MEGNKTEGEAEAAGGMILRVAMLQNVSGQALIIASLYTLLFLVGTLGETRHLTLEWG